MAASTDILGYIAAGTAANRPASATPPTGGSAFYFATDTGALSIWNGSAAAWVLATVTENAAAAITAAGTTQGTATVLTEQLNVITTCAIGAGVIVPATLNAPTRALNRGANSCLVYPPVGAQFEAYATNAAVSIAVGGALQVLMTSLTQGYLF